jgi:hypothetical protein
MAKYWYKPSFWRWWWSTKAPTGAKLLAATLTTAGVVFAGYELTGVFSEANAAQVYTYVQTLRQVHVEPVTTTRFETVRVRGHEVRVTVDPPPRTITGAPVREFLTVTTSHAGGVVTTHTVPVTQREMVTVVGPGQTVEVTRNVPVTRTETVGHAYTLTVSRSRTTTVAHDQTVTVQQTQTAPGQTVVAEHTVTQNTPVTTTLTKATTVPVTSTVATTVTKATTVPVTSTVATTVVATVSQPTTVTHTITATATVTETVGTTVTVIKTTTT